MTAVKPAFIEDHTWMQILNSVNVDATDLRQGLPPDEGTDEFEILGDAFDQYLRSIGASSTPSLRDVGSEQSSSDDVQQWMDFLRLLFAAVDEARDEGDTAASAATESVGDGYEGYGSTPGKQPTGAPSSASLQELPSWDSAGDPGPSY